MIIRQVYNAKEVAPVNDVTLEQAMVDCECEGGLSDREPPGTGQ